MQAHPTRSAGRSAQKRRLARPAVVTCSPRTPWGIHPALHDGRCPRCGWSRPDQAEAAARR